MEQPTSSLVKNLYFEFEQKYTSSLATKPSSHGSESTSDIGSVVKLSF